MAKHMVKERQDIKGSNYQQGVSGIVIVDKKGLKDSWKEGVHGKGDEYGTIPFQKHVILKIV